METPPQCPRLWNSMKPRSSKQQEWIRMTTSIIEFPVAGSFSSFEPIRSIENTLPSWLITGNNRTINSTRWTRDISFYIIFVNDLIRHHSKSSHLNRYVLSIDRRDSIKLYHRFSSKNTFYIFVPSNRNPGVFSTQTRGRSNRVIGSERSHMIDSRFQWLIFVLSNIYFRKKKK